QQQKSINLSTKEYTFLAGKLKAFLEKYQKNRKKHLQLSFHISPPPIKNNSSQRDWFVEFNLIDPVDPSVIIPSATLWHGSIELLELLQEKYEHPQIAFLEQLQQASHLWPALKNVLAQQFPQKIKISLEDISPFIENIAPKLNEHGFDVKIPSWWSDSPTKIRLRLLPDELAQDGELKKGYFSMNTIISFNWIISVNNQPMSMERFKQLAQLKVPFANHRGKWVKLDPQTMEKALQCVQEFYESMTLQEFLQEFMLKDHSAYSFDIQIDDQKQLLQPLSQFIEKEKIDTTEEVPELFQGSLRSYQKLGYAWLLFLSRIGFGACLADDMGLGKTIQTIAFLCRRIEKSTDQNTSLIISPTSILTNWFKEFEKFAPDLKILIHHGYDRFTEEVFNNEISNYDVVITTYSLAVLDFDLLNQINWDVLILDEAQNIKNPKTQQARHIKKFSSNFRIALTGTPIENRLSELWSIMDFLNPSYLGSLNHFKRKFVQKIENNPSGLHSKQLSKLIQPFILRRKKTDSAVISDLPKKIEQKIFCPLTEEQAMLYESVVQDLMQKLQFAESIHRKGFVFSAITKLKQICNHPSQYLKNKPTRNFERKSGKIIRLFEMLEEIIDNDEKALIFTQYKELGDLLQKQLQEHFNQEILFLNGSTPRKKRVELVNRFQNDSIENSPNLFILSLKAGGLGLNLTEATHVFHYDRWWNPAVENQATDRAYRIGQDKNVFVHKFITIGTLEEKIDQLIEDKKALAEKIVSSQYAWLNDLSTEKLRDLLSYKSVIIGGR
ncbi:MAG: DEAD/DEAH box helicase, partial [Asgard group archaeon]|nr:DEAD/DEAH box helicase [Asgard group archaeon]